MYNCDCMDLMEAEQWDLAIVDPPYGIKYDGNTTVRGKAGKSAGFSDFQHHEQKEWDKNRPKDVYFNKLQACTLNQIIWGGNYFADLLPASKGWIFWDKKITSKNNTNFSDGELAWTSFDCILRRFEYDWIGFGYLNNPQKEKKIHPTQKPVQVYRWLLKTYATEGDTILDTHGGSMSLAIACWEEGFDLDICELDKDYFNAAVQRFENHIAQQKLF